MTDCVDQAVVFDLDGTICDTRHRQHIIDEPPEHDRWLRYSMACAGDTPIEPMRELAQRCGRGIILLTGRNEQARALTERWLVDPGFLGWRRLIMRADGDHRPNPEWKAAKVAELLSEGICVTLMVDDHPGSCEAVGKLGVPTLHFDPGAWYGERTFATSDAAARP